MIQVQAVVQEATYDAGRVPLYLRVDFLVDKQGLLGRLGGWGLVNGKLHRPTSQGCISADVLCLKVCLLSDWRQNI